MSENDPLAARSKHLASVIPFIPYIRPSVVRRLQRARDDTTCFLISMDNAAKNPVMAGKIDATLHPIVSWCVPDPSKPLAQGCSLQFCFSVKEVQRFIADNTDGNAEQPCPMFGVSQMRQIIAEQTGGAESAIIIAESMPREFRFVFEEFDLLPLSQETLKEDSITTAAIEVVEQYVQQQNSAQHSPTTTYAGHFWSLTKRFLGSGAKLGARIMMFVLDNPWWSNVILTLVKILRVAICVATSFVDLKTSGVRVLNMLAEKLKQQLGPLFKGSALIFTLAETIVNCLASDTFSCIESTTDSVAQGFQLFTTVVHVLRKSIGPLLERCGLKFIMQLPKIVFDRQPTAIFARVLNLDTLRSTLTKQDFANVTALDFDLLGLLVLLDVLTSIGGDFLKFTLRFFPDSAIKTAIKDAMQKNVGKYSWVELMDRLKTVKSYHKTMFTGLAEMYFWVMDVFPCLFHYFMRNFRSLLVLGVIAPQDTNASCCLRDVVLNLQKQTVFDPDSRGEAAEAHAARQLARQDATVREKEQSWLEYMLSRPIKSTDTANDLETQFQKDKKDSIAKTDWHVWAAELGQPELKAETATMRAELEDSVWVARCSEAGGRVFPNSITTTGYIPFYFEQKNKHEQQWSVFPSTDVMQQQFPNAIWKKNGTTFVLLHKLPETVVNHMAKMQTPIYTIRVQ